MQYLRRASLALLLGSLSLTFPDTAGAQSTAPMVRVKIDQQRYVGQPLTLQGQELALLRRDGRLSRLTLDPQTTIVEPVSDAFQPYTPDQLQRRLEREFGSRYQVTATDNFLVVHPPGQAQDWARPFQNQFLNLNQYFQARGVQLERPVFPLVAVVLRSRDEFDRFLRDYHQFDSQLVGYYSPVSNRVITYDRSGGQNPRQLWTENGRTIIHEATHQIAFNTGIHRRFAQTPRWVSEGLAMYFEAPGVHDSAHYRRPEDRINTARLVELQGYYRDGRLEGMLESMLMSDEPFRTDPPAAYALAWGLTYYLVEAMPERYFPYLRVDPTADASRGARAVQFASAFGEDLPQLAARLKSYMLTMEAPSN